MPLCELKDIKGLIKTGRTLLGVDLGSKTIGLAVSDPGFKVASPLTTINRRKFTKDLDDLAKIIHERKVGGLIIGLPRNMDGTEGPAAQSARKFGDNLLARVDLIGDLAIVFWDERMSTQAVERFMKEDDMTRKRRGEVVDKAAAAYILQGALDALDNLK
jgi:putative Holliday junction resolvase